MHTITDTILALALLSVIVWLSLWADDIHQRQTAAENAAHKAMIKDSILHEHFSRCAFVAREDVEFISVGHKSHSCNCR